MTEDLTEVEFVSVIGEVVIDETVYASAISMRADTWDNKPFIREHTISILRSTIIGHAIDADYPGHTIADLDERTSALEHRIHRYTLDLSDNDKDQP